MNIPKKHTLWVDTLRISYKRRFWSILNPFKFFGRTIDPCNKQFWFTSLRWKHSKIEIKQKNSLVQTWHIPSRYGTFTYIYSSWFLWPPVDKCTSPMDPIGMYDYIYICILYLIIKLNHFPPSFGAQESPNKNKRLASPLTKALPCFRWNHQPPSAL